MNIAPIRLNSINSYYNNSINKNFTNNKVKQANNSNYKQADLFLLNLNASNVYFKGIDDVEKISERVASLRAKRNYETANNIVKKANTMAQAVSENYDLAMKELNDYIDSYEKKLGRFSSRSFKEDDGTSYRIVKRSTNKPPIMTVKKFDKEGMVLEIEACYDDAFFKKRTDLHIKEIVDGEMNTLDYDYKNDKLIVKKGISENEDGIVDTKAIFEITQGNLSSYVKNHSLFKFNLADDNSEYETCDFEYHFNQGKLHSYNEKRTTLSSAYRIDDLPLYERTKSEKRMVFKNDKLKTAMDKFALNMNEIYENYQPKKVYTTSADLLFDYETENQGELLQKVSTKNGLQTYEHQVGFSF